MPPHAVAAIWTERPSRLEALPNRRTDRHRVRSVEGRPPGVEHGTGRRPEARPARPAQFERILTGLRVLVVDDDSDVLELFETALSVCGAEVSSSDNARDAIALAVQTRPNVIVSDIAMVGEDGYWLVRELKTLPDDVLPNVPVIAATAYGREHPRARVLAAGFTEHAQKPIDPDALCRLVATVAGR